MSDIKVCSFCGKTSEEVVVVFENEKACICNKCTVAHMNTLAKGGHLDKDFVPSWSLCSVMTDYLVEIVDPEDNTMRDLTIEWLQDQMGDLKIYEVREVFLEEKLQELERNIASDELNLALHENIEELKNAAVEKATIPYKIEAFLNDNVRP